MNLREQNVKKMIFFAYLSLDFCEGFAFSFARMPMLVKGYHQVGCGVVGDCLKVHYERFGSSKFEGALQ